MKYLNYIIILPLFVFLIACSRTENKVEAPNVGHSLTSPTKNASSKIIHEGGWTIVSKVENGDRVYWFLAPEVNNVSPAMFKKIVYTGAKSELETKMVNQCDAPKQECDDLMSKFKSLSEKYK